jgi:integrase
MDIQIQEFELYLAKQGKHKSTIHTKIDLLRRLQKYASPITEESVSDYLYNLYKQGRSSTYLNTYLDMLRIYCRFANVPYFKVDYYKEKETFKTLLSNDEINSILELKPSRGGARERANWNRWTLFFSLCAMLGARPGEISRLTVDCIDTQNHTINIKETKTNYFRILPVPSKIRDDLYSYIKQLSTPYLFPSRRGGGEGVVDDVDWGYNFGVRVKRLGINKPGVSVYSFRFSAITRWLNDGVDVIKVQNLAGHRQISQTVHYTRYCIKDLAKAVEKDSLVKDGLSTKTLSKYVLEAVEALVGTDERFTKSVIDKPNRLTIDITFR